MSPADKAPSGKASAFKANEFGLMVAILVVIGLTTILDSNHSYWSDPLTSARDIVRQIAFLGIFSLGAAVVIIAGGIDLSSGSMIAFSGTICASAMMILAPEQMNNAQPVGAWVIIVAIAVTLVVGFLVGSLHAWLITSLDLPPFVATLASLVGLRSLARAICESVTEAKLGGKSTQIPIYDEAFRYIGNSVWIPCVIFIVLSLSVWILLGKTVIGRHIYALGGNEEAARLSGIRTDRVKWLAYCIGTMTATVAGILYIGDLSVASPQTLGRAYELNAIAAAVVGGCSLQGGVGTVSGTVLGVVFLRAVIDSVAKIIKTGADIYEGLIVGLVVVIAVAFNKLREGSWRGREAFPGPLGIVSIACLVLIAWILPTLMASITVGYICSVIALAVLVSVKALELRRKRAPESGEKPPAPAMD